MSADGPIYDKYIVKRTDGNDGPGDKHEQCDYFVLDLTHDRAARFAILSYAAAVQHTHPKLARDIRLRYSVVLK